MDIRNHFQLSQFDKLGDRHQHSFKLTLHQIQTDMRDVHFFFKKKMGFPKLNERGTADVFLGGKGLTVTVHLEAENAPRGKKARHIFTVKQVVAKVDKLKFAIRDSKHDTLIKVLRPLATGIIKKAISKAAEQGIRNGLEDLDRQLIELRDRIERNKQIEGKVSATPSRTRSRRTRTRAPSRATAPLSLPPRSATRSSPTSATPTDGLPRSTSARLPPRLRPATPARHGTRQPSPSCSPVRRIRATPRRPRPRTSAPRLTTPVATPVLLLLLALPLLVDLALLVRALPLRVQEASRTLLLRVSASPWNCFGLLDSERYPRSWCHRCRHWCYCVEHAGHHGCCS